MSERFGVNLSFCVKRWVTPALWAQVVRDELGLGLAQFSYDLVDPMWPDDLLDDQAAALKAACDAHGVTVHSAFIGLAHYTYNQLLHPDPRVRDVAEHWLGRAYRFAALAGIPAVGGPLGAVASRPDAHEPDAIGAADYDDLVARMHRLAATAKGHGLAELYVEPTPLRREWPSTIEQARQMMVDVRGSDVPWRYCVDWGHATFEPLYGRAEALMDGWLEALVDDIGMLHIQQTDGQFDRHWDFTETGIVEPAAAAALLDRTGHGEKPVFLEVFYPFERDDASVLDAVRRSVAVLKPAFAKG